MAFITINMRALLHNLQPKCLLILAATSFLGEAASDVKPLTEQQIADALLSHKIYLGERKPVWDPIEEKDIEDLKSNKEKLRLLGFAEQIPVISQRERRAKSNWSTICYAPIGSKGLIREITWAPRYAKKYGKKYVRFAIEWYNDNVHRKQFDTIRRYELVDINNLNDEIALCPSHVRREKEKKKFNEANRSKIAPKPRKADPPVVRKPSKRAFTEVLFRQKKGEKTSYPEFTLPEGGPDTNGSLSLRGEGDYMKLIASCGGTGFRNECYVYTKLEKEEYIFKQPNYNDRKYEHVLEVNLGGGHFYEFRFTDEVFYESVRIHGDKC